MNFRIDKSLIDNKLNAFLYGNDILSSPFVEGINSLETVYPRQVGGMIGAGLTYIIE
jgi:hypothetical protein